MPGFPSEKELRKHFKRHGAEFNAGDGNAYVSLAVAFCADPCPSGVDECVRTCDNKVGRFREATGEFAVLLSDRSAIITYHVLHDKHTVGVPLDRMHGCETSRQYFALDCICQKCPPL